MKVVAIGLNIVLALVLAGLSVPSAAASACADWRVVDGLVSGRAADCPALQTLTVLLQGAGIARGSEIPNPEQRINLNLAAEPLANGLRQILGGASFVVMPSTRRGENRHKVLIVLGAERKAPSRQMVAAAETDEVFARQRLSDTSLNSGDSGERHQALEELAYRHGEEHSREVLQQALADSDPALRGRALEMLKDTAETLPAEQLADLVKMDRDHGVRLQALNLLLDKAPNEVATDRAVQQSLADSDSRFRRMAKQLLDSHKLAAS